MPSYIVPVQGTTMTREGVPASAFSRGDVLTFNSSSQLSKIAALAATGVVGVALTDSVNSINGKCTYAVPTREAVFWSTCTPGSTYTRGASVNFNVDSASHLIANGSAGTVLGICVKGVSDIEGQSVESRIQFQFKDSVTIYGA